MKIADLIAIVCECLEDLGVGPEKSKAAALKPPPGTAPGASALTRMPAGPSTRASSLTSMVSPALAAE